MLHRHFYASPTRETSCVRYGEEPAFPSIKSSTQQLKAMILDKASNIVHEASNHFDRDLAYHRTTNGAIRGPDAGLGSWRSYLTCANVVRCYQSTVQRLHDDHVDFGDLVAISDAGQVGFMRK